MQVELKIRGHWVDIMLPPAMDKVIKVGLAYLDCAMYHPKEFELG